MRSAALLAALLLAAPAAALQRPDDVRKVYQFPADAIPRIDGDASDWAAVGGDYVIGSDQLAADDGSGRRPDPKSLSATVRVGWVRGLNRLYFLYEATDDVWDFDRPGIDNDILELVIDGDRSGGPLIARFRPDLPPAEGWFAFQNIHAQNYHIFTPPGSKDWAMAWGPQAAWIKRLPWSNIAYRYDFKSGQAGKLTAEFWITPFDHADPESAAKSVETSLIEDRVIGMAWAIIDRDGPSKRGDFWNLSPRHTMYGQASELRAFRLMPLEPRWRKAIAADWSFAILERDARRVAFRDASTGATGWRWDFGDGHVSTERDPVHSYATAGKFVVTLDVSGPAGAAKLSKVWDVSFTGDPPK